MIGLIVNVTVMVGLIMLALHRPGWGIGFALILGRHTFPDRVTPLVPAAPLLCAASAFGYWVSGRRLQLTVPAAMGTLLIGIVVVAGGFRHIGQTHDFVRLLTNDKSFFLTAASIPLLLLASTVQDTDVRTDLLRALVLVPLLLSLLLLATGGGERSGALGGGPITLATAIGVAMIILLHHHDPLLPPELVPFETPARAGVGLVLVVAMLATLSRQPLFSLVLVLSIASVFGMSRDRVHAADWRQLRRIRRLRALSIFASVTSVAALAQLVFGDSDSRFTLLANPSKEIERSRSFVWDAGIEMARSAGFWGHGFGATVRADAPEVVSYPHNFFLELWAEVGPIVTLIVTAALIWAAVTAFSQSNRVFALMAAYTFIGAQFSGDLYNSRTFYFFLVVAIVVPATASQSKNKTPAAPIAAPFTPASLTRTGS